MSNGRNFEVGAFHSPLGCELEVSIGGTTSLLKLGASACNLRNVTERHGEQVNGSYGVDVAQARTAAEMFIGDHIWAGIRDNGPTAPVAVGELGRDRLFLGIHAPELEQLTPADAIATHREYSHALAFMDDTARDNLLRDRANIEAWTERVAEDYALAIDEYATWREAARLAATYEDATPLPRSVNAGGELRSGQ